MRLQGFSLMPLGLSIAALAWISCSQEHPGDSPVPVIAALSCQDGTFRLEAEEGIASFHIALDDSASGGSYLDAETGLTREAHYALDVQRAGEYTLWLRLLTSSTSEDGFLVQIDGAQNHLFEAGRHSSWTWVEVGRFTLEADTTILSFTSLEPDLQLDSLFLSPTTELTPMSELSECDTPPSADGDADGDVDGDGDGDPTEPFVPGTPPSGVDHVERWFVDITDPPRELRSDFLGCHISPNTGWPDYESLPPPTFGYGLARSLDHNSDTLEADLQWARIEISPGNYDWSGVDAWIEETAGRTRIFTIIGTPEFYQQHPGEPWRFPYLVGGASPPADMSALARFVSALVARHPGEIDYVEIWNEPSFTWIGTDTDTTRWDPSFAASNGLPFFSGTPRDLATMARVVREILPSDTLLMAGAWEGQDGESSVNSLTRFSRAADGADGTGRDHVEAFSFHHYIYNNDPNRLIQSIDGYRARLAESGYPEDIEFHCSEIGHEEPTPASDLTTAEVAHNIRRATYIAAAMGVDTIAWYRYSIERTLGAPHRNPEVAEALDDGNAIAGRVVRQAALLDDGRIWLRFEDNDEVIE